MKKHPYIPLVLAVVALGFGNGCGSASAGTDGGGGNAPQAQGQPMSLCSADSECDNPYLTCVPQTFYACRDPGAAVADAGSALPICPATEQVTENLCTVRYQLPCQIDSDCGPAGFTCDHSCWNGGAPCGICSEEGDSSCRNDNQCPQGWSCYTPCPCGDTTPGTGICNPPFAMFSCPICVTQVDGG